MTCRQNQGKGESPEAKTQAGKQGHRNNNATINVFVTLHERKNYLKLQLEQR